jgi:metal-responsive CopG/Arc/MetJ family transcriptional regulator
LSKKFDDFLDKNLMDKSKVIEKLIEEYMENK